MARICRSPEWIDWHPAYVFLKLAAMKIRPATMARLGQIIYFGACAGAALIAFLVFAGILLNIGNENGAAIVRTLVIASVAWGLGRTALYFLAER
jgi:hypothetical protein